MEHVTDRCPEIEYLAIMTMSIVLHFAGTRFLSNARYEHDSPGFYLDDKGLNYTVSIQL